MNLNHTPSEQKERFDLKPLKAIIHGPPASGKTTLAKKLCLRYGAHYVSVKTMIEETLQELRDNIEKEKKRALLRENQAHKDEEKEGEDDEDESPVEDELEEDEGGEIEDWQEQIKDITELMEKSPNHKLADQYVARLMKTFLGKDPCKTRGYVLDGYPKTTEQAREIFGQIAETALAGEGGEGGVLPPMVGEGAMEGEGQTDAGMGVMGDAVNQILPDYVVSLVATDDFLCERVMKLPQREIQGTHYDEESMLRRLLEFREYNTERNTMLNFFDEIGVHPITVSLIDEETEKERDIDCIYDYVSDLFGEPIPGFGLSAEEMEQLRKLEREQRRLREEEERLEKQLLEEKARKEYQDKMEKWAETLEKLQMEEEKILVAQSEPLRYYLMKYVFPVLSKGLIEVAKIRPDDPLDYLAEYLFRENPEGRMFDPSYTRDGELILKQYEEQVAPTIEKSGGPIAEKMRSSYHEIL